LSFLCFFPLARATDRPAEKPADGLSLDRLGECQWRVTYRGRIYDLSPLTRESLSRPIENDIRYAMQRVPEANEHLEAMTKELRNARSHTMLASFFIGALLVTRILESKVTNDNIKDDYKIATVASGGFFLAATLFSFRSSKAAKEELVHAVEEFNAHSPHKIEPAVSGLGATE
jgi:hypothetical protein